MKLITYVITNVICLYLYLKVGLDNELKITIFSNLQSSYMRIDYFIFS